jgi:acyl-CoA reductase-like NAD-dependent aldehyde dehydrogenase
MLRGVRRFSTASAASALRAEASAVPLFINNKLVPSTATESVPVRCPATQDVLAYTPISTAGEMQAAVDAARAAYPKWSQTSVSNRARVMLKLQALIRERTDDLAHLISAEHGKTIEDAKGDVFRGLEVVEYACSVPSLMMGETVPNVATDVDTHSYRVPLGVCAGIAPFNFPAMIPLWMFPLAVRRPREGQHANPHAPFPLARHRLPRPPSSSPQHPAPSPHATRRSDVPQSPPGHPHHAPPPVFTKVTTGNTYVLKPSERVPLTTMLLADLARQAGLPDGVLNIIHGTHDAVNFICDDPTIRAVSFVGGDAAGRHIHARAGATGKRVQVREPSPACPHGLGTKLFF